MSEDPRTPFAKVDALTGRRIGYGPSRDADELDDFPLLTDIVSPQEVEAPWPAVPDAAPLPAVPAAGASADVPAEETGSTPEASTDALFDEGLPPNVRAHIEALFASQERRLEETLRRVVREELERLMQARGTGRSPL